MTSSNFFWSFYRIFLGENNIHQKIIDLGQDINRIDPYQIKYSHSCWFVKKIHYLFWILLLDFNLNVTLKKQKIKHTFKDTKLPNIFSSAYRVKILVLFINIKTGCRRKCIKLSFHWEHYLDLQSMKSFLWENI